uniref:Sushi domain-containing protein n=2 Tax=Araneus ventricosus TaxID=182803 RepID=A0A4Y2WP58_ARAVE|nr:hypothetical protein AVEN_15683-1 [Araneus ventricosus]
MEGTHCDITCDGQYQGTFHCYPGRPWNPPLPFCTVSKVASQRATCADPGIPRDGRRINPDGSDALDPRMFQEGESVIFTCNGEGSALQGKSFITCLADGSWSAPRPQCISFRVGSIYDGSSVESGFKPGNPPAPRPPPDSQATEPS